MNPLEELQHKFSPDYKPSSVFYLKRRPFLLACSLFIALAFMYILPEFVTRTNKDFSEWMLILLGFVVQITVFVIIYHQIKYALPNRKYLVIDKEGIHNGLIPPGASFTWDELDDGKFIIIYGTGEVTFHFIKISLKDRAYLKNQEAASVATLLARIGSFIFRRNNVYIFTYAIKGDHAEVVRAIQHYSNGQVKISS